MGTVYLVPSVGQLNFIDTGYTASLPYADLTDSQKNAVDIIVSQGVRFTSNEWIASASYGNYVGFYTDNVSYYVGYSYVDGTNYFAYRKNEYANVNKSIQPQGVTISNYAHNMSELPPDVDLYNSREELYVALSGIYTITYHYTNSTVSGPERASVGETVTVSALPDENYGITDASTQILVTNNDVSIPYQWNPATNTITFTMPDPS